MTQSIEEVCKELITKPGMAAGCNIFVQAVAQRFGNKAEVAVSGNADTIAANIRRLPFIPIGKNPLAATSLATRGKLVLGGLTRDEMTYTDKGGNKHTATMGHVVIVVPGGPSRPIRIILKNGKSQDCRGGYPYCYQGAANSAYRFLERTQVDAVFPSSRLNEVTYAYLDVD